MMKFNEVGNLGGEWETRWTKSGKAVATNSLAIPKRRKTDQGWEDEFTSWIRLTVWGDLAEQIAQLVPAKSRVIVDGEWWARPYQDEQGNKHVSVECTVRNIGVVARTPRRGAQYPAPVQPPRNDAAARQAANERGWGATVDDGWNSSTPIDGTVPF